MGNKTAKETPPPSLLSRSESHSYSPEELRDKWKKFALMHSSSSKTTRGLFGRSSSSLKANQMADMRYDDFKAFLDLYFQHRSETVQFFLLRAFDDELGYVSYKSAAVALGVLEQATVTEKFKFLFKSHDDDEDNLLTKEELASVIEQVVAVALFLGYDEDDFRQEMNSLLGRLDQEVDVEGRLSLERWIALGMNIVSLSRLLGLDFTLRSHYKTEEGKHEWRVKHFSHPAFCNYCRSLLLGLGRQGLICNLCGFTSHQACTEQIRKSSAHVCRGTCVTRAYQEMEPEHHWVAGHVGCSCTHCKKWVPSKLHFHGLTCGWCKATIHDKCQIPFGRVCDLGELRDSIVPATGFAVQVLKKKRSSRALNEDGSEPTLISTTTLSVIPLPETHPVCVFVNSKSGAKQGALLFRKFRHLLNPRQVFDLADGGPVDGLKMFLQASDFRIVCAGGDGTVGWVLSVLDSLAHGLSSDHYPPIAILPLGTGNDLARCLGWGGGYAGEDVTKILHSYITARVVMLDRWKLEFSAIDTSVETDPVPLSIMNNYFSVGVDASIALRFHHERESNPEKFKSRAKNKLFYAQYGAAEMFRSSCSDLEKFIELEVDGEFVPLPDLEGIAILNIPSMYGGTNLWGTQTSRRFQTQHIGDGLIEVVGIYGSLHVGQIKGGFRQHAKRIAQGAHIKLTTKKTYPMQTDGEPWVQAPCTVSISLFNQAPLLRKQVKARSIFGRRDKDELSRASAIRVHHAASVKPRNSLPLVTQDSPRSSEAPF